MLVKKSGFANTRSKSTFLYVWCFNPLFDYKLVSLACGFGYVKTSGQGDGRSCGSGHFSACKVVDVGRFAGGLDAVARNDKIVGSNGGFYSVHFISLDGE